MNKEMHDRITAALREFGFTSKEAAEFAIVLAMGSDGDRLILAEAILPPTAHLVEGSFF